MLLRTFLTSLLLAAISTATVSCAPTTTTTVVPTTTPIALPSTTFLFTVTISLGQPLSPIPLLQGSIRQVEPIANGTIRGPTLNATITGGFAAPIISGNNTVTGNTTSTTNISSPQIYVFGRTDDGNSSFFVQEEGVGVTRGQNTFLKVEVGGKYARLQELFVIGQPVMQADMKTVVVECFSVALPKGALS